jgi:hypothetical protein
MLWNLHSKTRLSIPRNRPEKMLFQDANLQRRKSKNRPTSRNPTKDVQEANVWSPKLNEPIPTKKNKELKFFYKKKSEKKSFKAFVLKLTDPKPKKRSRHLKKEKKIKIFSNKKFKKKLSFKVFASKTYRLKVTKKTPITKKKKK